MLSRTTTAIVLYNILFSLIVCTAIIAESNIALNEGEQFSMEKDVAQRCDHDFCNKIFAQHPSESLICDKKSNDCATVYRKTTTQNPLKKRTIIIYMAADNDLYVFAARNIRQMAEIGSNEFLNILVHLDIRIDRTKKVTRRYFIEKDTIWHVNAQDPLSQQMDSGNPATLISCCEWAVAYYPAEIYDLVLWNHGTGILEPAQGKIINPADLFTFNPATSLLELDRSIEFMDLFNIDKPNQRGVCWDDSTGHYLSNRKLDLALKTICTKIIGKKFGIICFDACLMSMIEVGSFIKNYAEIMVGSQEVELGMGLNYTDIFAPFMHTALDTSTFAKHIVNAYEKTYSTITYDYTYSAIDLTMLNSLEENVHNVSQLLIKILGNTKNSAMSRIIRDSRNKMVCTHFDEPSYIDIYHFYCNLLGNIKNFNPSSSNEQSTKNTLIKKLEEGKSIIKNIVMANVAGRNLKNAHGISIYFPERPTIHSSYREAEFLVKNSWGSFLSCYLFG